VLEILGDEMESEESLTAVYVTVPEIEDGNDEQCEEEAVVRDDQSSENVIRVVKS
jgi:hypothetical protein